MRLDLSNYYEEALKFPAGMGAICGGFTGLLAGIAPTILTGYTTFLLARAISTATLSLICGAIFGAVSGGLLGVLVAIAIPGSDLRE
jgi:hypothetical protein